MDRWSLARRVVDVFDDRVPGWAGRACFVLYIASGLLMSFDHISADAHLAITVVALFAWGIVASVRRLGELVAERDWLETLPPPQSPPA